MQEAWVQSLVREDPTCHVATKSVRNNSWASTPVPRDCSRWSPGDCAPQQEKPLQWEARTAPGEGPLLTTLREKPTPQPRPAQPNADEYRKGSKLLTNKAKKVQGRCKGHQHELLRKSDMASHHMKSSTSLFIREMQVRTARDMQFYHHLIWKNEKSGNIKCWRYGSAVSLIHHWWERELVGPRCYLLKKGITHSVAQKSHF